MSPTIKIKYNNSLTACICVAAIVVITYFAFSPTLNNGFTNWDDNDYVVNNQLVVSNSVPLAKILKTPVMGNYHPITIVSLALNYQNGKLDPFGYHLENMIFHLFNTMLIFLFIFLLTRRNLLMAAIVSLFFGIHPMHVESVAWVSERKDVLYVFFFIAALITYLRYSETKKISWYFFTLLLFILSCLSKGMAVVFPVILLLVDYLNAVKWKRRLLLEKIPFFALAILFGIVAVKAQESARFIVDVKTYTIIQKILFASYGALMYIVRLFVPFKLSAVYAYPDTNNIPLIFYLSPFIMLMASAVLIYFFQKKEKEIVFGLLFYFVSVVFVLQFISFGNSIMADRYSYLSYIGLLFVVSYLVNKAWVWLSRNKGVMLVSSRYLLAIIIIVGAVIFSFQTYALSQVWQNSETLWTQTIENYPDAPAAYGHRAEYYYFIHENDKSLSDLNKVLQLNPNNQKAYYNRGLLYMNNGKIDSALSDLDKVIELEPYYADAYDERGLIYCSTGRIDRALTDFEKAIEIDSVNVMGYYNRGIIYLNTGKNDLALADFNKTITLNPAHTDAYVSRGITYMNTGKNDLALADFNKAIVLDSTSAKSYYNRAVLYLNTNENNLALPDFTRAITLSPSYPFCYYSRGLCYNALNQYENAIADFSKAIELNPSIAMFWFNRSVAESKMGQKENAKADALKAQQLQGK